MNSSSMKFLKPYNDILKSYIGVLKHASFFLSLIAP